MGNYIDDMNKAADEMKARYNQAKAEEEANRKKEEAIQRKQQQDLDRNAEISQTKQHTYSCRFNSGSSHQRLVGQTGLQAGPSATGIR